MEAIRVKEGFAVDYTAVAAVDAGSVVVINNGMAGIALEYIPAGGIGAITLDGIFDIVHIDDNIGVGTVVYWNPTGNPYGGVAGTGGATTTAGTNIAIGRAVKAAASGAAAPTVRVKLWGGTVAPVNRFGPLDAVVADPGNAGAIPVNSSGTVKLISVGAETRTLAAPTFIGQQLLMYMDTDGGDIVVTCATAFNVAAHTTITFDAVGETIRLIAIEVGANLRWRTVMVDGATPG